MTEIDTPPVTTEEPLVPLKGAGSSMLERWVQADPDAAVKRIETILRLLDTLRIASIRATYPSDWIIHVSRDADGAVIAQRGYLQDIGAERAGKVWGVEVGNPAIEEKKYEDGTIAFYLLADAWSKVTGERLDYIEGSRWSGDPFFRRSLGPDEKVDPTDVRKAAYANLHGRAVRALSGLGGVPLEELRKAGLDVAKVVVVDYQKGAKGGESAGAGVGAADVVVAFGNSRGKKPGELEDKDLAWYVKTYGENVANPTKAPFVKNNQRVLDALKAEQERRARMAAHEAETGTKPEAPATAERPGDDPSTLRGQRLADLQVRLKDAVKDQRLIAPLLRLLTRDLFGQEKAAPSDLSDEELTKLNGVPEEILATMAKGVIGVSKEAKK